MQRLFRLSFLVLFLGIMTLSEGKAANVFVSGSVDPGHVRMFVKDSTYILDRDYFIRGTLIIEPGTEVKFYPNGRLIIHVGGRVIADGLADATYNNPTLTPNGLYNLDPIGTPGGTTNPLGFSGYADMNYYLYNYGDGRRTMDIDTERDITVHPSKYDYIFNVVLNKSERRIVDLQDPWNPAYMGNSNLEVVSFEQALLFKAARLEVDPLDDINLNIRPWRRLGNQSVNITPDKIRFIGQPVDNFSREWGHIIVLPGARAAFFRNVTFEGFKKDTTVDRANYYAVNDFQGLSAAEVSALNSKLNMLTNGSGGVISTFSSRTWLLNCEFNDNIARYKGGALQLLQAPQGFPKSNMNLGYYSPNKNPNITNRDGSISSIIRDNPIPLIDEIDEDDYDNGPEPISDYARQAYDDARLAVYLGRVRNLTFQRNKLVLANVVFRQVGNLRIVEDDLNNPAVFPVRYGNKAFGGAIYIAGEEGEEYRKIEIGLGINNSVTIGGTVRSFDDDDTFEAIANSAENYQNAASTMGARGGAVYVGRYTSLIAAGQYSGNRTYTKFLQDDKSGTNSGYYSMGGAIFGENTYGRLQLRGGPKREIIDNVTEFYNNESGAGGAIFVDGNVDPQMSPVIGGSDALVNTRDYGFGILFRENKAVTWGGAVYSKRNMAIHGAGGVESGELIGYGGNYPVRFLDNTAGYAGGALHVAIPNAFPPLPAQQRVVQIVRAEFRDNVVGEGIADDNKPEIRGGGAIYSLSGDLSLVKGTEFRGNKVYNGNGGAIALIHPVTSAKRYFLSDLDQVVMNDGIAVDYYPYNDVFTHAEQNFPPDARMLTTFYDNTIEVDQEVLESQSGSGTTQIGQGTLVTTSSLFGSQWIDNTMGYAVGFNGAIIKMTQGGTKWEYQNSGTNFRLNNVYFTSSQTGFAVGDRGIILKTVDGGRNWNMVYTSIDQRINDIKFVGTQTGFAVCNSGYILKTVNGGDTWTSMKPETADLHSVFFTGVNTGYAVGEIGLILKTTNGGASWDVQVANTFVDLNKVVFVDGSNGYVAGDAGTFLKTTNGGATWLKINTGTSQNLVTAFFTDLNTGFVAGTFGTLYATADAGNTWTMVDPGTKKHLYSIFFPTPTTGYITGEYGLLLNSTDAGVTWNTVRPADESLVDVNRLHQEIMLPENGVGLGGALYILDSVTVNRIGRQDSVKFNRVRIQGNKSFTGAAIYSDNFDMKLIFNRSLITSNEAFSTIGTEQNAIVGPVIRDASDNITGNHASHDLASAIIYGEIQGPLPNGIYSEAANSIYNNMARFLIRLPDAPNTKGVLAGTTGIGFGGTDTLRGNYWGRTEADVDLVIEHDKGNYPDAVQETFFVAENGQTQMQFLHNVSATDLRTQGPFESRHIYNYQPIPLKNVDGDENTPEANTIPENLLFSGWIYDIYDKGTDVKTADYSARRMSPIEDFAVGIPLAIRRFDNEELPSYGKYVKRWTRNPFMAEAENPDGTLKYPVLNALQDEFRPDNYGNYYHPIGYPLYLESMVDYTGLAERSNHDPRALNESVYFVINETTGDFIRVNLQQVSEEAPYRETYRARAELVPDSTNRYPKTEQRRTVEGLLNLGTGPNLLGKLFQDPYREDRATLPGRKWMAQDTRLGNVADLYSNRPDMPAENNNMATYFGGEKFRALPVDTGDVVRIVSRTVLWREGAVPAWEDGVEFKIVRSTEPPVWTGNIPWIQTDTTLRKIVVSDHPDRDYDTLFIEEMLNSIWVTEDRSYPQRSGWYSNPNDPNVGDDAVGRDSILTLTAVDSNNYYDPRALYSATEYSYLTYNWKVDANSGLARWLMVDSIPAEDDLNTTTQNPRDGAQGYMIFRGKPINPYVVPGGETVTVTAANYPPHYRTVDVLHDMGLDQDVIDNFIELFPPYFHAPAYDIVNARFLQQDTIDIGYNYKTKDYSFKIFVVDSTPRFLGPNSAREEVFRRINRAGDEQLYVTYEPSDYNEPCVTPDGFPIATLTDKLRFKIDFNTDDEMEDKAAVNWDFRFGKTAYGFMNVALRRDDTTRIDTTKYDQDGDGIENNEVITQTRPIWMANEYIHEFGDGTVDPVADPDVLYFTSEGKLDIRIDKNEAITLLTPAVQYNQALNLDTTFTVVVNDGHGGLNFMDVPVVINVAPEITTESLPPAKEDQDYNQWLIDSTDGKMIHVYDPNFDQKHVFELIYPNDSRNEIPRDPCFPEAGSWDISNMKTTPRWLNINSESGLLYGTPRVKDAPKNEKVTVVVTDEYGLTAVKQFDLRVDSTNHVPRVSSAPYVRCVDQGSPYSDTLLVSDLDLLRDNEAETLTIKLYDKDDAEITGMTVTPSSIKGNGTKDTVAIVISTNSFDLKRESDGKVTIKVRVTDAYGDSYELIYRLRVSDATDFVVPVYVENSTGAVEVLYWGTAPQGATTGDGLDQDTVGQLDRNMCEYELPPLPPIDVFDTRWSIPKVTGTLRNIFPQAPQGIQETRVYRAKIQPGGENGITSPVYPITITWDSDLIPDVNNTTKNPAGSTWWLQDGHSSGNYFNIHMKSGYGNMVNWVDVEVTGSIIKVTIKDNQVYRFNILFDWASPVAPIAGLPNEAKIVSVSPNPYSGGTAMIQFGIPKESKVDVDIIDALGNVVARVAGGSYGAGYHNLEWNGRDINGNELPSGHYTTRLVSNGVTSAYPMVIVK